MWRLGQRLQEPEVTRLPWVMKNPARDARPIMSVESGDAGHYALYVHTEEHAMQLLMINDWLGWILL